MHRRCSIAGLMLVATLLATGCGDSRKADEAPAKPFAGRSLKVGVLGAEGLIPSIRAQTGEWSAETSANLSVADKPATIDEVGSVDVVVFPGDRLGDLIDRDLLVPWSEESLRPAPRSPDAAPKEGEAADEPPPDAFGYNDVIASQRDQVSKYGSDRPALPVGASGLVLVYQRTAFESEPQKTAAAAAKLTLEVPKTWEELDALAKFFQGRDWSGDGRPDAGIAIAWGKDVEGVATTTFLARAASLGQHKDQYSFLFDSDALHPRLTTPPFIEALARNVDLLRFGPDGAKGMDVVAARKAFREGKVAMLIDRAEAFSQWSGTKPTPIGVAPLPGSPRVYDPFRREWETPARPNRPSYLPFGGGWLVGVVKSSANRDAALNYARYLAGPETTNRIRSDKTFPMLPTRSKQLGGGIADPRSAPGVDSRGWSDAVGATLNASRVVPGLRIPDAEGYLADLANGLESAVADKPAADALAEVAKAWDERTDKLGRDRQLWHYRRSLNSLVTLPVPPPRPAN